MKELIVFNLFVAKPEDYIHAWRLNKFLESICKSCYIASFIEVVTMLNGYDSKK